MIHEVLCAHCNRPMTRGLEQAYVTRKDAHGTVERGILVRYYHANRASVSSCNQAFDIEEAAP